jgi:hypothetical protein
VSRLWRKLPHDASTSDGRRRVQTRLIQQEASTA